MYTPTPTYWTNPPPPFLPGSRHAPVPGWGANPAVAGPARVGVGGLGSYKVGSVVPHEWIVKGGFWSQSAGTPPCPPGAVDTGTTGCQYTGVIAERHVNPDDLNWGYKLLDEWIAERCNAGEYVAISEPYVDAVMNTEAVAVFAGPAAPASPNVGPGNMPPMATPACGSAPGSLKPGSLKFPPASSNGEDDGKRKLLIVGGVTVVGLGITGYLIYHLTR